MRSDYRTTGRSRDHYIPADIDQLQGALSCGSRLDTAPKAAAWDAQGRTARDIVSLMHVSEGLIVHHSTGICWTRSARLHRSRADLVHPRPAQRAEDGTQQGWAHSYTAWAHSLLGDHAVAARHNHEAAGLFEAAGDLHGTLHAMSSHADTLLHAGRYEESVTEHIRALAFLEQAGDRIEPHSADFNRANLQTSLGVAHTHLKDWSEAADHLRAAVDICRTSGHTVLESRALVHLGDALLAAGHRDEARDAFTQCLSLGGAANPQHITTARERLADLDAR